MTSLPTPAEIARAQQTWRALKPAARAALLALKTDAAAPVHHSTAAALRRRGLLDELGCVTAAGARVVVHRPRQVLAVAPRRAPHRRRQPARGGPRMSASKVVGYCPMGCGESLRLSDNGRVECAAPGCPDPQAVSTILADGESEHVVDFALNVFTVRHPLRERIDDQLLDCQLHQHIWNLDGPPEPPGRYRATRDGDDWAFTAMPEGTSS